MILCISNVMLLNQIIELRNNIDLDYDIFIFSDVNRTMEISNILIVKLKI